MTESDILFEIGHYWVCAEKFGRRGSPGFAVYRIADGGTHSVRVASIGDGPGPTLGIERAIAEAKRRAKP